MSPMMQMTAAPIMYTPMSDALDRHEYSVSKSRKVASTGGGRAWSEDEEVYLLQTRLQKMPYKHIAAHLKKTELACRLHYHQLSHGSNRRKRTSSSSSGSSTGGHSPVLPVQHSAPSPGPVLHPHHHHLHHHHHHHHHEQQQQQQHAHHHHQGLLSRSASPATSAASYHSPSPHALQLPRILAPDEADNHSSGNSPRGGALPAILPKPASMTLALAGAVGSPTAQRAYPGGSSPLPEPHPHMAYRGRPTSAHHAPHLHQHLQLDCSALPPPPTHTNSTELAAWLPPSAVDMARLHAVYAAHRAGFWAAVAADYGGGASPVVLEAAWRTGGGSASGAMGVAGMGGIGGGMGVSTPITPVGSPDERVSGGGGAAERKGSDKTRISALLEGDGA